MSKGQKILLFGFLVMLAALVYLEASKQQPLSWFPSYHKEDKIPLGTYVLHNLMVDAYPSKFNEIKKTPFETLADSTLAGTYFFVNDDIYFDEAELERIYKWVENGNTVFAAASHFSEAFLDTLHLEMNTAILLETIGTKPLMQLVNKNLKQPEPYLLDRDVQQRYFAKIDTLSHIVLGVSQPYNDKLKITKPLVNFIKAPVGKGAFYIHTQPEVFSNYFLLENNNAAYTKNVLAYLNTEKTILWDNEYKSGKPINLSPLQIILGNQYLKWAYYLLLIGAVLFVLFEGKRKQRSIPIVIPNTNKTVEYTQTIASMYWDKKENHLIAKKQITLFLEYVRTRLRVPTENVNTRFFATVAARSGNTEADTKNLFIFIEKIQNQNATSAAELQKLYAEITTFKTKTDGKS